MIKRLVTVVAVVLCFIACNKEDKKTNCSPEEFRYTFLHGKEVDTIQQTPDRFFATLVNGNHLVFRYKHTSEICPWIADSGVFDELVFQVPVNSTSFELNTAAALQEAKCYFTRSCYCANVSSRNVTGTIRGTKLSDTSWLLEVNISEPNQHIGLSFKKMFVREG